MKEKMIGKSSNKMTFILVAIIVVLVAILIYAFVIKPAYSGYVTNIKNQGITQGVNLAVSSIITQLQQTGYVQVPLGNNQTLTLITPQQCSQLLQNNSANSTR